ncbi:hypothetical protein BFW01_g4126 [Lasiodiplodia theobromae]|uniref:FMR1-interacting protein 1 conserved domain-containing protein n=1 Tax=Lasiodiplodia theobromae TaxID=45133 RepID=A0A5N5D5B2_9PEZI|nr:Ccch zinc finger protein [Lasiodiplodia theobromae]KAB2572534.1 hypothetical protein DBV05_g8773 [Lasiodiplodia theobromae]KAF4535995.1 Ccch zinc finger protein [Lasiodiplodia theobromae]KAF9633232.1 hypothetical protein BFW01_g4126 [Lasiodiplodia theobromae]
MLGLTPRGDMHEDSEEDDADEEAKFKSMGGVLQFEYKGKSSTLKTPEDIAAWIEERRKRFPTKQRIAQKQKEEEEKRRTREEAQAERKPRYPQKERDTKKRKRKDDDKPDKAIRKAEKLREKLRKAEEAVAKARAKLDSKAANENTPKRNLGIDYDSDDSAGKSGDDSSSLAESSSDVSTDSESDSSSSSGGSSDDDAPPEEESSAKRPVKVRLPNRKAVQATTTRPRRDKGKEAPKRVTLRERMAEQERRQDAEVVLRFVKMLGEKGMLE